MPKRESCAQHGFTLPEIILVTLLIALLGSAIYHVFAQGLKLWNWGAQDHAQTDLYIGFEKLIDDVRNATKYGTAKFKGSTDSMQFYTQSTSVSVIGILQVQYGYDRQKQALKRTQRTYRQLLNGGRDSSEDIVANHLLSCLFSYYYSDRKNAHEWKNSWDDPCLPEAIKVAVDYLDHKRVKNIVRTILVPAGGCGNLT